MHHIDRRLFLKLATSCLCVGTFELAIAAPERGEKNETTPGAWMDQWIDRWEHNARPVDGILYLGRFADPVYFLTKEISWKPNIDQTNALSSITVPVGFVTDFASIPRIFWSLLRPDGVYAYAAVIHDYLYWTQDLPREKCDLIFKLAMEDFKIPTAEIQVIYKAVRAGGGKAWSDNAKLKRTGERRILKVYPTDPTVTWPLFKKKDGVFI